MTTESQAGDRRKKYLREEYVSRINHVLDYIEIHIAEDLTLEDLALVASFSPFYFHRIFGAMVGETLNAFIQRIRVEKAATQLINNPKKSVTEVALDCGFSGPTTFARAFREHFDMSASQWRAGGYLQDGKIRQVAGKEGQPSDKNGKDSGIPSYYTEVDIQNQKWRVTMQGELKTIHKELGITFVYVTHNQSEALAMANRIVVMNKGTIEQVGTPQELFEMPKTRFIAEFVGENNVFEGVAILSDKSGIVRISSLGREFTVIAKSKVPPKGKRLVLVVRSDLISMHSDVEDKEKPGLNCPGLHQSSDDALKP